MRKRITSLVLIILLITNIISTINSISVQAMVEDLNIISNTDTTLTIAKNWAKDKGATEEFINLADLYWEFYKEHGNINPAMAYIQSALETNYGKFGGVIDASYHNPCGLKTRSGGTNEDPNAHQRFNNWGEGVQAHLDHLALYAGASGYPRSNTYDPRHFTYLFGTIKTVQQLSGKWASDPNYGDSIIRLYNELDEYTIKSLPCRMSIDSPESGAEIVNNKVIVEGWALNKSGIKEVKVYVDGVFKKNALIDLPRLDVDQAYPGYSEGKNSGYKAEIDLTRIPQGNRKIKVEQIGNDGSKQTAEREINLKKKVARTIIDVPNTGALITNNKVTVQGWVLNDSGVKEVKVYVDGVLKGNAVIGLPRLDVDRVYPGYPGGQNSGYKAEIDLTQIPQGNRKIKVQQTGYDGSIQAAEREINLKKKVARTIIDSPNTGALITNNKVTVQGWALNDSGVKEIKVYVDGVLKGNAVIGLPRLDVDRVYPGYPGGQNSGYKAEIDLTQIPQGNRKIKVEQIGYDGSIQAAEREINLKKKVARTIIDSPNAGAVIADDKVTVQGWVLNDSGVKEVKVYVDGVFKGNATIGLQRLDVDKVYPGYPGGQNSGYKADIDLTQIPQGNRKIKVEQIGYDGSIQAAEREINLKKKVARTIIDSPVAGTVITDKKVTVQGWVLNNSGVKEVKVYVDGVFKGNATIGLQRLDVDKVYPGYPGGQNSGYKAEIDLAQVSQGNRTIKVEQTGYDGSKQIAERSIVVNNTKIIVIDPGHNYGGDYGAESRFSGVTYSETELNMQSAVKLQQQLENRGYKVYMTRQPWDRLTDTLSVSLQKRVDYANALGADLFISLHHNSSSSSSATGVSTYYSTYKPGLKDVREDLIPLTSGYDGYTDTRPTNQSILSRELSKNVVNSLAYNCNYSKSDSDSGRIGYVDRGLKVTRETNMASLLIELGFISNENEAKRCSDSNEQINKAKVIADEVSKMF